MGTTFYNEGIRAISGDGVNWELAVIDNHTAAELRINVFGTENYNFLKFTNLLEFNKFANAILKNEQTVSNAIDYKGNCYEVWRSTDFLGFVCRNICSAKEQNILFIDKKEFSDFKDGIKSLQDKFEPLIDKKLS